ncbi:MAG: hypothetical protein WBP79_08685 [Candidatus Acidiferrales bacterium]
MDKPLQLFEEENVKRQGIPMAREVEKSICGARCGPRKTNSADGYAKMNRNISPRVRQVPVEDGYHYFEPADVSEC